MALIKKIDVEKHFAARRAMRLGRIWPVSSPVAAGTVPAGKAANAPRLIGNRTLQNSTPGISATSTPMVAGSGVREDRTLPGSRQE